MSVIRDDESPHLLFMRELESALAEEGLRISDDARAYLTAILSEGHLDIGRAIAPEYCAALNETSDTVREQKLKGVGNSALILCGLWWQYIEHNHAYRHGADRQYHEEMGVRAYRLIDKELFLEIAENFSELTVVLARMSSPLIARDDRQLLRLYEYALRTQSKIAIKLLRARGIILEADSGKEH